MCTGLFILIQPSGGTPAIGWQSCKTGEMHGKAG